MSTTGGTLPLVYSWTGPAGFTAATQDLTNLAAGTYNLSVTDANNCVATASVSITEPGAITLAETHQNSACGLATGSVNITASGGTEPYSYSWDSGERTEDLSGKAAGNYTVTITDAAGCQSQLTVAISDQNGPVLAVSSQTNALCNGSGTGAITMSTTGGTLPLLYNWTGPAGFTAATQDLTNLAAGTYNLSVTDANNCVATASVSITEPGAITLAETHQNSACGLATGSVNITAGGGTGPYSYSWDSGEWTEDLSGKAAGNYTVTITDAAGCQSQLTVASSDQNGPVLAVSSQTNALCNGSGTGAITMSTTGGTLPLLYSWTGPAGFTAARQDLTNLAAGTYNLRVTDANNCVATASVSITEPGAITLAETHQNSACGLATGSINIAASGGTGPYSYSWDSGERTEDLSGKAAGNYPLTITDREGCQKKITVAMSDQNGPQITMDSQSNAICNGTENGSINIRTTG